MYRVSIGIGNFRRLVIMEERRKTEGPLIVNTGRRCKVCMPTKLSREAHLHCT